MIPQILHEIPELSIYSFELQVATQLIPFELTNKSFIFIFNYF